MNDSPSTEATLTRVELAAILDARAALGQAEDALATARFHLRHAGDTEHATAVAALTDQVYAMRQALAAVVAARV